MHSSPHTTRFPHINSGLVRSGKDQDGWHSSENRNRPPRKNQPLPLTFPKLSVTGESVSLPLCTPAKNRLRFLGLHEGSPRPSPEEEQNRSSRVCLSSHHWALAGGPALHIEGRKISSLLAISSLWAITGASIQALRHEQMCHLSGGRGEFDMIEGTEGKSLSSDPG